MSDYDTDNWSGLSVGETVALFHSLSVPWRIAGGHALDLFLKHQTRPHEDTDVLVLRRDQHDVQKHLVGWKLFKTNQLGLAPWEPNEFLAPPINCFWARPADDAPWSFEVMLMDTEEDYWVYRRLPAIRGRLSRLGLVSPDGIPYMRPEIQLLYKSSNHRDKDFGDLRNVSPHLPPESREWLLGCLRMQYSEGHPWINYIGPLAAVGRLHSGTDDLAARHDEYAVEAFEHKADGI